MKDEIKIYLPYPYSFLGLKIFLKREIGFLFTNLSIYLFREDNEIATSEDWNTWTKKHGEAKLFNEMIFHAAVAFCMQHELKRNFTKENLSIALSAAPDTDKEKIVKCWKQSQSFGLKDEKKKTIQKAK